MPPPLLYARRAKFGQNLRLSGFPRAPVYTTGFRVAVLVEGESGLDVFATTGDIQAAYESLSDIDLYRLRRYARIFILGTEYVDPQELLNDVCVRALQAAAGEPGRRWPKSRVHFIPFVIETMRSLADDSRTSGWLTRSEPLDEMKGDVVVDRLATISTPSAEEQLLEIEARNAAGTRAANVAVQIKNYFEKDAEVSRLLECLTQGIRGARAIEACGFRDETHYATVRRRLRRGFDVLFPERRSM